MPSFCILPLTWGWKGHKTQGGPSPEGPGQMARLGHSEDTLNLRSMAPSLDLQGLQTRGLSPPGRDSQDAELPDSGLIAPIAWMPGQV